MRPTPIHCGTCDKYHLSLRGQNPEWMQMVRLAAQGFTQEEIARQIGRASKKAVAVEFVQIRRHFYALSIPNLVAICISLGLIDPTEFVPKLEEPHHATPA